MVRILVIDDEKLVLHCLEAIFETEKIEVVSVTTGKKGLEKIKEEVFDLVISDFRLPDIDSRNLLKKIQTLPRPKPRPIILITGLRNYLVTPDLLAFGVVSLIKKPFDYDVLMSEIRSHLPALVRIAVLEPDKEAETFIIKHLKAAGYENIICPKNISELLSLPQEQSIHLLLIDYNCFEKELPQWQQLSAQPQSPQPILLLKNDTKNLEQPLKNKAEVFFLSLPVYPIQLYNTILNALSGKKNKQVLLENQY